MAKNDRVAVALNLPEQIAECFQSDVCPDLDPLALKIAQIITNAKGISDVTKLVKPNNVYEATK